MQSRSDAQLLREYAEHGAEPAFTEIVTRHANLVYSAALRQVDSPDIAAEVAQSVFVALARGAGSLSSRLAEDASLAGWLCRSARNISLNHRRDEFRRHTRERQAMEELHTIPETAPDWERLRAVLDEAMSELSEPDYDALVMRFFNNQDLQSVGRALGVTDDTAQKRVSRALDKLREHLSRRGISTTAAALSVVLSVNAVQAAPAGLLAAISAVAVAGTAVSTSTVIATAKTIAMTTLQKALITAVFTAAVGAGIYQSRQNYTLRSQRQMLEQQQAPLTAQLEQLQKDRDHATNRLAALLAENEQLRADAAQLPKLRGEVARFRAATADSSAARSDPRQALMESWLAREDKLRQITQQNPDKTIPELQLLSEQDWLNSARDAKFDTDKDLRRTLADLRHRAENDFAATTSQAVSKYMKANNGQFPTDLSQLQPYFATPMDEAILQRWQILPQSALPNQKMGGDWVITEKTPVDPALDQSWAIGPGSYGSSNYQSPNLTAAIATLDPVQKAYAAANNGKDPTDPSQILPYLTTPEQQAAYQTLMQKRSTNDPSR
jgi:RNA polymerase sigma factor (sigma-70 family)